jgi:cytochrome P450
MTLSTGPALAIDDAATVFVDPTAYADEARFDAAASLLRRESPVHWIDVDSDYAPFWAVTRYADIVRVERDANFLAAPRRKLQPAALDQREVRENQQLRTLMWMDEPDHRTYRAIAAKWFRRPGVLDGLEDRVRSLAPHYVDRLGDAGGACDFVTAVSYHYPLAVILPTLGVPDEDYPKILRLAQQLAGVMDESLRRSADPVTHVDVVRDLLDYFGKLVTLRRKQPTDDLASAIANAKIGGDYIPLREATSYCFLFATAGHDTVNAALAGGLLSLLEHPDQMARLRADRDLLRSAVEEMLRWVTPVKQFMRTAVEDCDVGGTPVAAGDAVYLAYHSANRDEEVFPEPFTFDVGRDPNRHLAFGTGTHYCLGAGLARMEMHALFDELLSRADTVELAGEPTKRATIFVGGLTSLPVHCTLRSNGVES